MIAETSRLIIQIVAVLILAGCVFGLVAPQGFIGVVRQVMAKPSGWIFAVVIRILLGAALLTAAQGSRFPLVFTILGWIAIAAAIGILLMGHSRLQSIVAWVERWGPTAMRIALAFGAAFAGFLLFAA